MDRLIASRHSLAEALSARGVVPVIGPEMLFVDLPQASGEAGPVPLYRVVAERLLATYGAELPSSDRDGAGSGADSNSGWSLHRAVAQVLATNRDVSTERVRRSVSAIVKDTASAVSASPLLDRLVALRVFDLFVCLTPDDLLVDALRRALGNDAVDVGAYAPNADSSVAVDLAPAKPGTARVFFPLGRSAAGTRIAIHEEDALEYFYKFQEDGARRAPNLLTELRSRDLLLLGCSLPDWLGRGFLRMANETRLSSQDKKMEFFAADAQDPALNGFLARFNPNATVFPWSPSEFVAELEGLVAASRPLATPGTIAAPASPVAPTAAARRAASTGNGAGPSVFISYASEDRDAARSIADALLAIGFADVWFDRVKLVAGDDWSDRIGAAIEDCDFFVPVLSLQADRRREGVFWEEWRKAVVRAMRVNDAFVLPIGIDGAAPDRCDYQRIFSGFTSDFRRIHLTHAPQGCFATDADGQLRQVVERFRRGDRG